MAGIQDYAPDGPYGGNGGSAYDARDNEHKIQRIETWEAAWQGQNPVLGAIQFQFDDDTYSGRVGGKDPAIDYYPKTPFVFEDGEKIDSMTVYAGDFINGFKFHTTRDNEFQVGGTDGPNDVQNLGNGEWAGATGRDNIHGADAVVDSMILYFND
ncbi:hypothetical protein BDV24DRAFT_175046 [Aspergillus arachidicola]|uniref:Jacalin-type lectin domain-containing protein n=1 Tax=Aspergillus arachidicola TaxID=656916 RepID=A0A2G7FTM1_9EURO|nr:hypothetical protein BDV24DRAFT_175046 [Aspergillus arachidicola]PIG83978.1 hypothetical protein AARAC_008635 [Aspergillus arachidicola]